MARQMHGDSVMRGTQECAGKGTGGARTRWWSGRALLYVFGFGGAAVLDTMTPLGVADWLIEVTLIWAAATWGGPQELIAVATLGTAGIAAGLWSSSGTLIPFWVDALNRLAAIGVVWGIVQVTLARHRAGAETEVLRGLLPICAECKSIRSRTGVWHSLESYIAGHSQATFTHTFCPECAEKYLPGVSGAGELQD
jgi:hypothetical protein